MVSTEKIFAPMVPMGSIGMTNVIAVNIVK